MPVAIRQSDRSTPGGAVYATCDGPVYAADVPGRWWPTAQAAGRGLNAARSSVVLALATGPPCRGVRLTATPPPWRAAELAAAERARVATYRVSPWRAAVGPGPASKNCERRWAEREAE